MYASIYSPIIVCQETVIYAGGEMNDEEGQPILKGNSSKPKDVTEILISVFPGIWQVNDLEKLSIFRQEQHPWRMTYRACIRRNAVI